MKKILLFLLIQSQFSYADIQSIEMRVFIHDSSGIAIEGAFVKGGFYDDVLINKINRDSHSGITNKDGFAFLAGKENLYIELNIEKSGFYSSRARINVTNDKGKNVSVLLRKIISPTLMTKHKLIKEIPELNESIGFDFFKGNFSTTGAYSDINIKATQNVTDYGNYTQKVTFTFINKNDGFIEYESDREWFTSDFKTAYKAPIKGYKNILTFFQKRESQPPKLTRKNINMPFFIRIRTVLDERGNVKEAFYCKILTGVRLYGVLGKRPAFGMTYECNPNVNDINMESSKAS